MKPKKIKVGEYYKFKLHNGKFYYCKVTKITTYNEWLPERDHKDIGGTKIVLYKQRWDRTDRVTEGSAELISHFTSTWEWVPKLKGVLEMGL